MVRLIISVKLSFGTTQKTLQSETRDPQRQDSGHLRQIIIGYSAEDKTTQHLGSAKVSSAKPSSGTAQKTLQTQHFGETDHPGNTIIRYSTKAVQLHKGLIGGNMISRSWSSGGLRLSSLAPVNKPREAVTCLGISALQLSILMTASVKKSNLLLQETATSAEGPAVQDLWLHILHQGQWLHRPTDRAGNHSPLFNSPAAVSWPGLQPRGVQRGNHDLRPFRS